MAGHSVPLGSPEARRHGEFGLTDTSLISLAGVTRASRDRVVLPSLCETDGLTDPSAAACRGPLTTSSNFDALPEIRDVANGKGAARQRAADRETEQQSNKAGPTRTETIMSFPAMSIDDESTSSSDSDALPSDVQMVVGTESSDRKRQSRHATSEANAESNRWRPIADGQPYPEGRTPTPMRDRRQAEEHSTLARRMARSMVETLFESCRGCPYHVVLLANSGLGLGQSLVLRTPPTASDAPHPQPQSVPAKCPAIVVLCMRGYEAPSMNYVKMVSQRNAATTPPVIVVIADGPDEFDLVDTLRMKQAFVDRGAREVIVMQPTSKTLPVLVEMALFRMQRKATRAAVAALRPGAKEPRVSQGDVGPWAGLLTDFPRLEGFDERSRLGVGSSIGFLRLTKSIREGQFTDVYLAEKGGGKPVILKLVHKVRVEEISQARSVINEVRFMKLLRHDNVVFLEGFGHSRLNVFVVLGCSCTVDLLTHLLRLGTAPSFNLIAGLQRQLLAGVDHCHSKDVAHCNLSMRSMFVPGQVQHVDMSVPLLQISCFSNAVHANETMRGVLGSMPFVAPEAMSGGSYLARGVDMWACGVIFLELSFGVGAMAQMLGWEKGRAPDRSCAVELLGFFDDLRHVQSSRDYHLGYDVPAAITKLLLGMCDPRWQDRWDAASVDASCCLKELAALA